ncbi:hypothetical protein ACIG87_12375 [Micromonospora sp. NPDC051925]|uniref:hypothetical protein n=1 Tax=Micromonospora sp. NPDC051925 TaxID=3364288 RepID=UPI0037CCBC25
MCEFGGLDLSVTVELGSPLADLREHAAIRIVVLLDDPQEAAAASGDVFQRPPQHRDLSALLLGGLLGGDVQAAGGQLDSIGTEDVDVEEPVGGVE